MTKRVLIACESSGVVRRIFSTHPGLEVYSCDLRKSEDDSEFHIIGDVRDVLDDRWDLIIAHPPCRYIARSGLHHNTNNPERQRRTREGLHFFRLFLETPVRYVCIENPVGKASTTFRPPDQYVQPYYFGHDASKNTGLWLKNLPPLRYTQYIKPRYVGGLPRWANQTDSGNNRLPPSGDRSFERARTYPGIALAMFKQWTPYILESTTPNLFVDTWKVSPNPD